MEALTFISGIVSIITAFALTWFVLSPRIHEGALVKMGLVVIVMALLASASHALMNTDHWYALWAINIALRTGILLVVLGLMWRRKKCGSWKGVTDWGELR